MVSSVLGGSGSREESPALFPNKEECAKKIHEFDQYKRDCQLLREIYEQMLKNQKASALERVQARVNELLRRWQAFRPFKLDDKFLVRLARNSDISSDLFEIVNITKASSTLNEILSDREFEGSLKTVYAFLQESMVLNKDGSRRKARIVTISKTLLYLAGFAPAFDSVVLQRLEDVGWYLSPGLWAPDFYLRTLERIAKEQVDWERTNGPMNSLSPDLPIGQIMNRILWSPT